jgi:DNA-binding SARP family transcriptional activator
MRSGADRHRPRHGQPYGGRDVRSFIAGVKARQAGVTEAEPTVEPERPRDPEHLREPERIDPAAPPTTAPGSTHEPEPETVPEPVPLITVRRLDDLLAGIDVLVRVLGEVEAVRGDERLVPVRQKGLEAIAYLAVREASVDREELEISLFPDGANAAKTVYNTVSAARKLVGDELFPPTEGGRYELAGQVATDHRLFRDLVAEAEAVEDPRVAVELLVEALGMVQGEPFTGVGRGYPWAGRYRGMIIGQVIDAAERLVELCLDAGDWTRAEWAARQGLLAFPADERMHRLLMRIAHGAGDVPGVQRVLAELCTLLAAADLDIDATQLLHPDTLQLAHELTTTPSGTPLPTRLRTA